MSQLSEIAIVFPAITVTNFRMKYIYDQVICQLLSSLPLFICYLQIAHGLDRDKYGLISTGNDETPEFFLT